MAVKHLEQFHQRQGRLSLAILIPRKRIDPATEDFGSLSLVKIELLAHVGDEARINDGRIHLWDANKVPS